MKNRVRIPRKNASAILDLAKKVYAKHQADGANSELQLLNWDAMAAPIAEAQQLHDEALMHRMEMRRRIQTRSAKLLAISSKLRDSRDVLTGLHKTEMRSLEQWGFDVLDPRVSIPIEDDTEVLKKKA